MNKYLWIVLSVLLISGCSDGGQENSLPEGVGNVLWLQDDGSDYELQFNEDSTVSYYSPGAGNPYRDFDLCETYEYNADTQNFSFDSDACTMEFVKIAENNSELTLLVDGEVVTYRKSKE